MRSSPHSGPSPPAGRRPDRSAPAASNTRMPESCNSNTAARMVRQRTSSAACASSHGCSACQTAGGTARSMSISSAATRSAGMPSHGGPWNGRQPGSVRATCGPLQRGPKSFCAKKARYARQSSVSRSLKALPRSRMAQAKQRSASLRYARQV
ncbi:hypothetical protein DL770_011231 [Monosporascus sp. CRB-9-2]|nr:hypothetical protein DL770_011231 [Monosporascus sp. CRB-9-2]